jgi:hypothetical protein
MLHGITRLARKQHGIFNAKDSYHNKTRKPQRVLRDIANTI